MPDPLPHLEPGGHAFAIVGLTLPAAGLWSPSAGIYVWGDYAPNWDQRGDEWERDAELTLWDASGSVMLDRPVGLRINGEWTRCMPQKSLRIYFDHDDGESETYAHDFFGDGPTASERLLLRQTMRAQYLLKDHWATSLYRDLGHLTSRWTPAVGYLNGEYWGIYALRERIDGKWATTTLGYDGDDVILVKDGEAEHGDLQAWLDFLDWVGNHPHPESHAFFVEASRRFDLEAYLDWILINVVSASAENGFQHNLAILRDPQGMWHYVMWDEDDILYDENLQADHLHFYAASSSSEYEFYRPPLSYFYSFAQVSQYCRLLNQLMHNAEFRTLLKYQAAARLEGAMAATPTQARMDSVLALFAPEVPLFAGRFEPSDLDQVQTAAASYNAFLAARHPIVMDQVVAFRDEFLAPVELSAFTAAVDSAGVQLAWRTERERDNRGFEVWRAAGDSTALQFVASYLDDAELRGEESSDVPRYYGYRDRDAPADVVLWYQLRHVDTGGQPTVHDWLVHVGPPRWSGLVINEFMADNDGVNADEAGEYEDWIELYNGSDVPISLLSLYLTDDLGDPLQWALPNATLPAGGFLLVWCDDDEVQGRYHANFKLSAGGEEIGLFDAEGGAVATVDAITFGPQTTDVSLGRFPDGGDEWVFYTQPTPAAPNVDVTAVGEASVVGGVLQDVKLDRNASDASPRVHFTLARGVRIMADIFDVRGRRVRRLQEGPLAGGAHTLTWDRRDDGGRTVAGGVYLLRLRAGQEAVTRKLGIVR